MDQPKKETIKYRLIAHIQQLNLNKNLSFQTKVTWKRNVNKTETETVTHRNCCSLFDQRLELQLSLIYSHLQNKFEPKLTEFAIVVIYQGKIKSGGYVKYDAAEIVNNNYNGQRVSLPLAQCPDPKATLEVLFDYEIISESSRSLFNELSMINPANDSNLSQIHFQDEEQDHNKRSTDIVPIDTADLCTQTKSQKNTSSLQKEFSNMNSLLDKFQSMAKKLKSSPKSLFSDDQNTTKNESLQITSIPTEHEEKLKLHITQIQSELELKRALIVEYERKLNEAEKKIEEQEIKLELAQQKYSQLKAESTNICIDHVLAQSQRKYRQLYQRTLKELEQIRDNASVELNFSKNQNFKKFVEEVQSMEEVPQFQPHFKVNPAESHLNQKVEKLERQSVELQTKVAGMSHSIAQLFNAAYDYGGAKLLDYLQGSIGLTQS